VKKLLIIPALLLSSAVMASDYNYELTPVIGYNLPEGNLDYDTQFLIGLEAQYNSDTFLKPELSVLYSDADYENNSPASTDIYRIMLNGVHEYSYKDNMTPFSKVGIGYETIDKHLEDNRDSLFIDAGIGVKLPLAKAISLKLETIYMLKYNDNRLDNNLAILAGLNFAFGQKPLPAPPARPEIKRQILKPKPTPVVKPKPPVVQPKPVDGDNDKDGVLNSLDRCPATPAGNVVNNDGCTKEVNLHVNFENGSYNVDEASKALVKKFADFLIARPNYTAQIIGHTNNIGRESDNQVLSQNRANSVRDLIVEYGVAQDRVTAIGRGESDPIATNDTAEGLAQNRRIEATLNKN